MKSWLKYLSCILIIFGLIYANINFVSKCMLIVEVSYEVEFLILAMSISALVFVVVGVLLGSEKLLSERKKEGHWKINLPKLLILGIPALYFSLWLVLAYTDLGMIYKPVWRLSLEKHSLDFIPAIQVMLGYTLITSFYKQSAIKQKQSDSNPITYDATEIIE